MNFKSTQIPYQQTKLFSQLVRDYVDAKQTAFDFVKFAPTLEGVAK